MTDAELLDIAERERWTIYESMGNWYVEVRGDPGIHTRLTLRGAMEHAALSRACAVERGE